MTKDTAKTEFFDQIATKWDSWEDLPTLHENLISGFQSLGVSSNEIVLDVGCGTGNLSLALLSVLGSKGRVVAVDISPAMLGEAQKKTQDSRITWYLSDACSVPEKEGSFHRIICYSVWPHFEDIDKVVAEFDRLLKPGGHLHVWHLNSKETINKIHAEASEAVRDDVLAPAEETAAHIEKHGFEILDIVDNEERYLVTARKSERKVSAS